MKNRRDVCAAGDAGFVEYAGLPGIVKTGYMNSPEQQSRFCSQHKPRQVTFIDNKEHVRCRTVEMILSKKITRSNTLYEVREVQL